MQPYQEASQEIRRQKDAPGKFLKTAALTLPAVAGGGAALSRIIPFLSDMIPTSLAAKGLAKVDPRMGKFIDGAVAAGHTIDEAIGFIKDKVEPSKQEPTKQNRSIIEQYSPELFGVLKQLIGQGKSPLQAGALAQLDKQYQKVIKQMETDHSAPFSAIIESTFGSSQQAPQQDGQPQQPAQVQPGQGQQALMAILQKINSKLGQ